MGRASYAKPEDDEAKSVDCDMPRVEVRLAPWTPVPRLMKQVSEVTLVMIDVCREIFSNIRLANAKAFA